MFDLPQLPAAFADKMAGGKVTVVANKEEWAAKFAEAKAGGKNVVVDFWAEWCGPCRMIAPKYAELSEEMDNWVFLKIDVDSEDTAAITAECGIRAMPTFQFFNGDGGKIDELVGASVDNLIAKLKAH